jgi:hypothetical protein
MMIKLAVVLLAFAGGVLGTTALPSSAAALFGWQVVDVSPGDVLNIRASPGGSSKVLVGHPNGALLSLTGRCTGGVHLDAISGLPATKQQRLVRNTWCEVWVDPQGAGDWRVGWVRGRYIRPL